MCLRGKDVSPTSVGLRSGVSGWRRGVEVLTAYYLDPIKFDDSNVFKHCCRSPLSMFVSPTLTLRFLILWIGLVSTNSSQTPVWIPKIKGHITITRVWWLRHFHYLALWRYLTPVSTGKKSYVTSFGGISFSLVYNLVI